MKQETPDLRTASQRFPAARKPAVPPYSWTPVWKPAAPVAEPNAMAFAFFLVYLFFCFSRFHEFFLPIPKLMFLLGSIAFIFTMVTAGSFQWMQSRQTALLLVFTGAMCVSVPFSFWKGGSIKAILAWVPYLLLFLIGAQLVRTKKALHRTLLVVALAISFVVVLSFFAGSFVRSRLGLGSSVGNANDLAALILFGIPCWGILAQKETRNVLRLLLVTACVLLSLIAIVKTGSRGALLSLIAMTLSIFWRLSAPKKLGFMVLVLLAGSLTYACLPRSIASRYVTLVSDVDNPYQRMDPDEAVARESSAARQLLLKQSIRLTLKHPLWGVGVGQFTVADSQDFKDQGRRVDWHQTHNSYTEVSSELGIPGLVVYVLLLGSCYLTARSVYRRAHSQPELQPLAWTASCIHLSVISFCVSSFFLTLAYTFYVPTLALLTYGLNRWAEREWMTPVPQAGPVFTSQPVAGKA